MRNALVVAALAAAVVSIPALAKLPPVSDDAKAKAAEAAAKAAHGGKVASYQLCKAMDRVAARYQSDAAKAGKAVGKPTETPACADPGPYVAATPPAAAPAAPPPAAAQPASDKKS